MNDAADNAPPSNRPKIILAVMAVVSLAYVGHSLWFNAHYVRTDNAQVGGDIIPISARISGFVTEVAVKEHQLVKTGQLLVTLDHRDAQARLAQAQAELTVAQSNAGDSEHIGQAQAQSQAASAQAQQARAQITQAQAEHTQALRELNRLKALIARDVVSQHDVDVADAFERSARARLQASRDGANAAGKQVSVTLAGLRTADARVLAASAARDLAAHALEDTRIVASSDGIVSQKSVEIGQFMQPGQPMLNLVPNDSVWIVANLKETEIKGIHPGSAAKFTIDAYDGVEWLGEVESISPATGSKFTLLPPDNSTGNFTKVVQRLPVRIRLAAAQHKDLTLRAGMSADVTISRD
jgi:membrane fusion protein (multidrug efflux system)